MIDWRSKQVGMICSTRNRCPMIVNIILELTMISPDHNVVDSIIAITLDVTMINHNHIR